MVNFIRSKWVGISGAGLYLLNTFGPEFLPYWLRVSGAVFGVSLVALWAATKHFRWIKEHTKATSFHAGLIISLETAVIGLVLTIVDAEFGLAPERLPTAREVAVEQGGGDNFCYFRALLNQLQPGGGYEWQLINKQQRPIPNMEMHRYQIIDGESQYRGHWEPATCVTDSVNQTTANEDSIMPGKHYFKFQSINSWEQSLEITGGKEPKQIGVIYRDGKEIWRFPDEPR